jgi:hypothetical protein
MTKDRTATRLIHLCRIVRDGHIKCAFEPCLDFWPIIVVTSRQVLTADACAPFLLL